MAIVLAGCAPRVTSLTVPLVQYGRRIWLLSLELRCPPRFPSPFAALFVPSPLASSNMHTPGSLVCARNRDWVVLPQEEEGVVRLRPVDSPDEEPTGIFVPLEPHAIQSATYPRPEPCRAGGLVSARLLHNAVRLGLRSGAGPFRSLGHLSVTPRPYQYVPLIMALRQDPVRLLIADDVGVGKTIEAGMIARELLDRGIIRRIGVLCAPHLCDQWEEELRTRFGIASAVVQSARIRRLERDLPRANDTIFRYYRHLVASIDLIKTERFKRRFLADAPEFIIVDEAHTAARPRGASDRQHQRFALVQELAADPTRHIVLATATPHSGIEESFRSLLGLLNPAFDVPAQPAPPRSKLVSHVIQRKRSDLRQWLGVDTPFPERVATERPYLMTAAYNRLFTDILDYCREYTSIAEEARQRQRVRYWAALTILRCVLSSPGAAQAALAHRKDTLQVKREEAPELPDTQSAEWISRQVLDSAEEDQAADWLPPFRVEEPGDALDTTDEQKLNGFLKRAKALAGPKADAKLREAAAAVSDLLRHGCKPIVYCRFIQTAYYVAAQLEPLLQEFHPGVHIKAVTGNEGDSEQREELVRALARHPLRVLVATDCLSEGINLQHHYDAVLHYDLPWNPNRLEQREGRVDRFGQLRDTVYTVLLFGEDNEMDLVVLDVLLRKAQAIKRSLGISVPVPVESEEVLKALVESVLLRGRSAGHQLSLGFEDARVSRLHDAWEQQAQQEGQTRAYFAQHGIEPDEVDREMRAMAPVLGREQDVEHFVGHALPLFNGALRPTRQAGEFELHAGDLAGPMAARGRDMEFSLRVAFTGNHTPGVTLLGRNHPIVAMMAETYLARALHSDKPQFARCGTAYSALVAIRTAVLVLRLRYLIEAEGVQFAEEVVVCAFEPKGQGIHWLHPLQQEASRLLRDTKPIGNMAALERQAHVAWALKILTDDWYSSIVHERARQLAEAHMRLRGSLQGQHTRIVPHCPPDIIGCFVLVPARTGA